MITPILPALNTPIPAHMEPGSPQETRTLQDLSREFEALVLRQILKQGRKEIIQSGLFETSKTADLYNDMINFHLADSISRSGDIGLAESLSRQLSRQNDASNHPQPKDPAREH